jgi:hypothetical protein
MFAAILSSFCFNDGFASIKMKSFFFLINYEVGDCFWV